MIIGVTGGIGCGKTTVSRLFADLGCRILNADRLVSHIYSSDPGVQQRLQESFGTGILNEKGDINTSALSKVLLKPGGAETLNRIVHPAVIERIHAEYDSFRAEHPDGIMVVEAPLLYETGIENDFDAVICVYCPEETGMKRFSEFRGISERETRGRLHLQMSVEEKTKRADYIVDNSGTLEETKKQVREIYDQILKG